MRTLLQMLSLGWILAAGGREALLAQMPTAAANLRLRARQDLGIVVADSSATAYGQKCGLPTIAAAIRMRQTLGPAGRAALNLLTGRPLLQTSIRIGDFRIHFDTSGVNEPAMLDPNSNRITGSWRQFVDSVGSIAAYVSRVEIDSLGYAAPPPDDTLGGGPEFDIYIEELGNEYGETAPDNDALQEGGTSTSFITIDNDFIFVYPPANRGIPALRVTLAHEYHHAIQIGSYGFWPSELYYHEISSVWMEDVVYTDVNDYYNYLFAPWSQFYNEDVTFTQSSGPIMYSRGIWGHYIAKRFGRDAMRRTWEEIRFMRPLKSIDFTLRTWYASTFGMAFAEWSLWNYFTGSRFDPQYYPEGAQYPEIAQDAADFTVPFRVVPGVLAPLSARYYQIEGPRDSITLALSNIDYDAAIAGNMSTEGYSFSLSTTSTDATYVQAAAGVYFRFDAASKANWWTWSIVNGMVGVPVLPEGTAFPNPYLSDGKNAVHIPSSAFNGTLSIFSSSMDLVYSSAQASTIYFGKRVFTWDGRTNENAKAQSGVYIFVLSLDGRSLTGKIVLVRK